MNVILNVLSMISTLAIFLLVLNFMWKTAAVYIKIFNGTMFSNIKTYNVLSLVSLALLFYLLKISFYLPWN